MAARAAGAANATAKPAPHNGASALCGQSGDGLQPAAGGRDGCDLAAAGRKACVTCDSHAPASSIARRGAAEAAPAGAESSAPQAISARRKEHAQRGAFAQRNAPATAAGAPACAEATQRRRARARASGARGAAQAERVAAMVPRWGAQVRERRGVVHATSSDRKEDALASPAARFVRRPAQRVLLLRPLSAPVTCAQRARAASAPPALCARARCARRAPAPRSCSFAPSLHRAAQPPRPRSPPCRRARRWCRRSMSWGRRRWHWARWSGKARDVVVVVAAPPRFAVASRAPPQRRRGRDLAGVPCARRHRAATGAACWRVPGAQRTSVAGM